MKEWLNVQVPKSAEGLAKSPEIRTIFIASSATTLLAPSYFGLEAAHKIWFSPLKR